MKAPGTEENYLERISNEVKRSFESRRSVLSFAEWFELLSQNPATFLRNSAQYLRDVFDYFGTTVQERPWGPTQRFGLFDAPWCHGFNRVAGQEGVQNELYRLLLNFVRAGRITKLILLHGPNGSAKSSLIRCLQEGAETYSKMEEGALYTYSWIFPADKVVKSRLGFDRSSEKKPAAAAHSYAGLDPDQVDARLPCELRDHPIFLIPREQRVSIFNDLTERNVLPEDFVISRYIREGDLSPRDRSIYDALLVAYNGDHGEVLRHIQVERFYMSAQHGYGLGRVEPQMHVDAEARQLTADQSIANLPRSLQSIPLFELSGPLVSANRGVLEYSDLLKRPLEGFKYLLTTSEEATASLPRFSIQLDEILIGSSNEKHLDAFKEHPDWNSFKGRIELVTVPYLRSVSDEIAIYQHHFEGVAQDKPTSPHVVDVAATWAVLTRLVKPEVERYPEHLREAIKRLNPMEKLRLYDLGNCPSWMSAKDARELRGQIKSMLEETRSSRAYEGRFGASAREIKTMLLNAAQNTRYKTLTPLPVFEELEEMVRDPSIYEFLRLEVKNGFFDHASFIAEVRNWWLDTLDIEIRTSMGLVEEARHEALFTKYIRHVSQLLKGEKIHDPITGKYVDPDEELLADVETILLAPNESKEDFRKALISRIGAWSLDHTGQAPDYRALFPRYVQKMEEDYFNKQRRVVTKHLGSLLLLLSGDDKGLSEADRDVARTTRDTMQSRFNYAPECTAECASFLLKSRYAQAADRLSSEPVGPKKK